MAPKKISTILLVFWTAAAAAEFLDCAPPSSVAGVELVSNLGDGSETDEWREGNAPCDARTACHRLKPRVLLPAAALEREDNFCSRESTKLAHRGQSLY